MYRNIRCSGKLVGKYIDYHGHTKLHRPTGRFKAMIDSLNIKLQSKRKARDL